MLCLLEQFFVLQRFRSVLFNFRCHSHLPHHFQQLLVMVLEWLRQHHLKLKMFKCHFLAGGGVPGPHYFCWWQWWNGSNLPHLKSPGPLWALHHIICNLFKSLPRMPLHPAGRSLNYKEPRREKKTKQTKTKHAQKPGSGYKDTRGNSVNRRSRLSTPTLSKGTLISKSPVFWKPVLIKRQNEVYRPIAFVSQGLRKTKMSNYSSMKLELLALKCAVTELFREYLQGSKIPNLQQTKTP